MALRTVVTSQENSRTPKACDKEANIECSNKHDVELTKQRRGSKDSFSSSRTSTIESLPGAAYIRSQTMSFDSLPLLSEDASPRLYDASDWDIGKGQSNASPCEQHSQDPSWTCWTLEKSDRLQEAVDQIFGTGASSLLGLSFSLTVADPQLEGCPLIGCSSGFTELCGYEMSEIVGFNCRFLVDPVPADQVDQSIRCRCRDFCIAAKEGKTYTVPPHEIEDWLPTNRPPSEMIAVQKNARKDGTLFNSMFLMRIVSLGDFDEESHYIIALQSELPEGKADLPMLCQHLKQLDINMAKVEKILGQYFIVSGSMRRQDLDSDDDHWDSDDDSLDL